MSALSLWNAAWIAALSSAILYGCYRAVEWRWPERYIGMHETFGLSSQETWLRFLGYRAVPTFIVAATCFVTVERVGGSVWFAAAVVWGLSIAATHGRVVVEAIRARRGEVNYAGYHIQMILLLTGVLVISVFAIPAWQALVPAPSDLVSAIWSGLLVAGLGGFVLATLKPRSEAAPHYGAEYFIERAASDVGIELLDWLFLECIRTGADPILMKSLLVVEAVQRPKWFRNMERIGVRLKLAKTSGAMQMASSRPLTDRESVTIAAEQYAGVWSLRYRDSGEYSAWEPDLGDLWPVATRHNGDAAFASSVAEVAKSLVYSSDTFHYTSTSESGLVLELRRYAGSFALRGVSRSEKLIIIEFREGQATDLRAVSIPGATIGQWRAWQTRISPSADHIAIVDVPSMRGTKLTVQQGEVTEAKAFRLNAPSPEPIFAETEEPTPIEIVPESWGPRLMNTASHSSGWRAEALRWRKSRAGITSSRDPRLKNRRLRNRLEVKR